VARLITVSSRVASRWLRDRSGWVYGPRP